MVARLVRDEEVVGSNPAIPTTSDHPVALVGCRVLCVGASYRSNARVRPGGKMVVLRHMRRAGEVVTVLAGIELIGIGALSLLREYVYLLGYSMILVGAFMLLAGSLSMIGSPFWILVALPVDIPLAVFGRTADLDLADGSNALRLWRDNRKSVV